MTTARKAKSRPLSQLNARLPPQRSKSYMNKRTALPVARHNDDDTERRRKLLRGPSSDPQGKP